MRLVTEHFALLVAVLVMAVAIAALPGWLRLVLIVPAALGGLWALLRLSQAQVPANDLACGLEDDAAEQRVEADEAEPGWSFAA